MSSPQESVDVTNYSIYRETASIITLQRSNGELWQFSVSGTPDVGIGDTMIYQNAALVFGAESGVLIEPSSSLRYGIVLAVRLD